MPRARALTLQPEALEDLEHWVRSHRKVVLRILGLIRESCRDPFSGIGKPEPLKHLGSDVWSRRITAQDRLIYRVSELHIDVLQARYHY